MFTAFLQATQEAGYATDDVNGYRQEGFAKFDRNVHRGRRLSASKAYLKPAMKRPNLTVTTRALVTRVLFEGKRAVGVEYRRGRGALQQVRAEEVILCGGAINSPQLLQLSGVGNAGELSALGIDVVQDLPGVGENMQDHLEVYVPVRLQAAGLHAAVHGEVAPPSSGCSGSSARVRRRPTTSRRVVSPVATRTSSIPT
ncbi:Oxygen-dependent choline dehydrogenase [Streptomyces violarus]